MRKILKFNQFPPGPVPKGFVYYNRTTREIKVDTDLGQKTYSAVYVPSDIDALSINGYYPLYRNESLAKQISPEGRAILYNQSNLGVPAPLGVTYPVYMPQGVDSYQGNHIDPGGDLDGDGILNFRDPDIIGLNALPGAGYNGVDPFVTSGGSNVNIKDYLDNPDSGTTNNTDEDILVAIGSSGIIVGPNGEIEYFFGPGSAILKPGWTLFEDEGSSSSPLPEPNPAYGGTDPFITAGGNSVNIKDYIDTPDKGSHNNTGQPILVNAVKPGIIVCDDGSVSYFLPGAVTIDDGCTMFLDQTAGKTSPLSSPTPAYVGIDPFVTSLGNSVNIKDYLDDPDGGSINDTGGPITIQVTEESIIVKPDGTVIIIDPVPATVTLEEGSVLFSKKSTFIEKIKTSGIVPPDSFPEPEPEPTDPGAISIQWFEDSGGNNLVLRSSEFESSDPAGQLWEEASGDSYMPRETIYESTTESAQYFEEDSNGNILPKESSN